MTVGAPPPIVFDFTINLTTIIGVAVWIITMAIAWTKFGGRMDLLELRVSHVESAMEKIATALEMLAGSEKSLVLIHEQISTLQRDLSTLHATVEQMRVGEGFISGPRRGNMQGEYPSRGNADAGR